MTRPHAILCAIGTTLALLLLPSCGLSDARADETGKQAESDSKSQQDTKDMTTKSTLPSKRTYSKSGFDITPLSKTEIAELAKKLSPEAFRVTQNSGTEPAFCGNLVDNKSRGNIAAWCADCRFFER